MKSKLIYLLLLLFPLASSAETSPRKTVEKFCQLDFNGARLSSSTYQDLIPLISYEAEPGWDMLLAVSGYKVVSQEIQDDSAKVLVEYNIERAWPAILAQTEITKYSKATFHLSKVGEIWKINEYIFYLRVSGELCHTIAYCAE